MASTINWDKAALVIVDPLIDLLSPQSVVWDIIGDHVTEINLVNKLKQLIAGAQKAGIPVMYSRVEITDEEYGSMSCKSGLQSLMAERRMCVPGKGGRYHPDFEPNGGIIELSARKGPSAVHSDFALQMRRRGLETAVFAGMVANLCVESHVRDAIEAGFGAYVVRDAIGAISKESLEATLANFELHATGTMTTDEFIDSTQPATA